MKERLKRLFQFYKNKRTADPIGFWFFHFAAFFIVFPVLFYVIFLKAPGNFPSQELFYLEEGMTLSQVSEELSKQNFIKSPFWLKNAVILLRGEDKIKTGEYFFDKPESTFQIARRLVKGDFDLAPIKVTIHEGLNIYEIAKVLERKFPKFSTDQFLALAKEREGYLFPDTYFFTPNTKAPNFVEVMEKNFYQKIEEIKDEVESSDKSLEDIIKMASIIETEARTRESRKIISGILWRRLEIDMPLQVDVTFKYINGKNSFNLTTDDLKIDSPYNTYVHNGLPPTPISNPGLDAILAALEPTETEFLFFLADKWGNIHYAATHDEHVDNKKNFLQ